MPWKKGQSGNPNGRPGNPEIQELRNAIKKVQKTRKDTLLVHFVNQAYADKNVLIAVIKKLVPDLSTTELNNATEEAFRIIIDKK